MAWMVLVGVILAVEYAALTNAAPQTFDVEHNLQQNVQQNDASVEFSNNFNDLTTSQDAQKLNNLGQRLIEILLHPNKGIPLIYVEDYPLDEKAQQDDEYISQFQELQSQSTHNLNEYPTKRSRYYRKYPWKRQNSREVYDAENRYLCQPSREDVFRLLVALHEARQGNGRTLNFCNRKRPATAVFTNIRFLGRRK